MSYLDTDLMMSESPFTSSMGSPQTIVVDVPYSVLALYFVLGALSASLGFVIVILAFRLAPRKK